MPVLQFLEDQAKKAIPSPVKDIFNNPVSRAGGNIAKGLVNWGESGVKSAYDIGEGAVGSAIGNKQIVANANQAKNTNFPQFASPITRPLLQGAEQIAHPFTQHSFQPTTPDQLQLLGSQPIQNINKGVASTYQAGQAEGENPLVAGLRAGAYGVGQTAQDTLTALGLKAGVSGLAKSTSDIAGAAKPLDEAGGGKPFDSNGKPTSKSMQFMNKEIPAPPGGSIAKKFFTDDKLQNMAENENATQIEKDVKPVVGEVVAQKIAPAIAKAGDKNVVSNVIDNALEEHNPSIANAAPSPTPPLATDITTPSVEGGVNAQGSDQIPNSGPKSMGFLNSTTRQRGVYDTLEKSPTSTPELKEAVGNIEPQTYAVKPNAPMVARAKDLVNNNFDVATERIKQKGALNDEDTAVGFQLLSKAQKEGRMDDAVEIASKLAKSGTINGRAVQANAIWGRLTPEGMLKFAARQINKAKENPNLIGSPPELTPEIAKKITDNMEIMRSLPGGEVKETADTLQKQIENNRTTPDVPRAVKDTIQQLSLFPEEEANPALNTGQAVAKNVERAAAPPKVRNQADALVAEITKKVKQEMLEPKVARVGPTAIDTLKEVFGRNPEAQEAFPYAQQILRDKYANSPQMMDALDKFFGSKLGNPAASSTFNRAISEQLKTNQTKVSQIIQNSWNQQRTSVEQIAQDLVSNGFDEQSARAVAKEVGGRLNQQVSDAKLGALQNMARQAPERVMPTLLQKINKLSNLGALDNKDYLDMARAKLNAPELSSEAAQRLSQLSQEIQDNPHASDQLMKEVYDTIRSAIPAGMGQKIFGVWRAGLLTSGQILPKVAASHIVTYGAETTTRALATAIDKFVSNFTEQRSTAFTQKGTMSGLKTALTSSGKLLKTGIDTDIGGRGSKLDFSTSIQYGDSVPGKFMGAYVNLVGRLHGSVYKFFADPEFARSISEQAIVEAKNARLKGAEADRYIAAHIAEPSQEALDAAEKTAEYTAFQNRTKLGDIAQTIQQKGGVLGKVIAPFTQIPSSIAMKVLDYSPAGAMKTVVEGIKAARTDEGWSIADQRAFVNGLGRSIVGTAAIIPGLMLYNRGMMTLGYPSDTNEQKLWQDEGKVPNAVKIGGQWRSLASLGPLGSVLQIGGGMAESLLQGKDIGTATMNGFLSGAQSISQASYLQGASQLISAVQNPSASGGTYLKGEASSLIPAGINSLATATDQYSRATTGNNVAQSALDTIKSRIPGLRETLPTTRDAFGNKVKEGETGLEKVIDPFNSSTAATPGPLLKELRRLDNAGFGEMPAKIPTKFNFGTSKQPDYVNLDTTQQRIITYMIGQATEYGWAQVVNSPSYQQLGDDQLKQAALKSIYDNAYSQGVQEFQQIFQTGRNAPNYQQTKAAPSKPLTKV